MPKRTTKLTTKQTGQQRPSKKKYKEETSDTASNAKSVTPCTKTTSLMRTRETVITQNMNKGRWGSVNPNKITYLPTMPRRQTVRCLISRSWNPRPAAVLESLPHTCALS
ncbi:hypothetical protein EV1_005543 [Malus domestica]